MARNHGPYDISDASGIVVFISHEPPDQLGANNLQYVKVKWKGPHKKVEQEAIFKYTLVPKRE